MVAKNSKSQIPNPKLRVKKGDLVRILLGKDRGRVATVLGVLPATGQVVVEGINMVYKHIRARRAGEKGQRVQIAAPLDASNVQVVCPACKRSTRIGYRMEGTDKVRFCKHCQALIPVKKQAA